MKTRAEIQLIRVIVMKLQSVTMHLVHIEQFFAKHDIEEVSFVFNLIEP